MSRPGPGHRPTRRRGGFALADFLTGMLLLAGALGAFATITRAKFDALAAGDQHARAVAAAEEAIDHVRAVGLPRAPEGQADVDGFRLVATFEPADRALAGAEGRLEARLLRLAEGEAHDLLEVRAVVRWQDGPGRRARVALSTVAPLPPAGGGR